jgi:hypothetical protein
VREKAVFIDIGFSEAAELYDQQSGSNNQLLELAKHYLLTVIRITETPLKLFALRARK